MLHTASLALFLLTSTIFRCDVPGEPVTFADRPCRDGTAVKLPPVSTISMPPLTDSERELLDRRARESRERAARRQKRLSRARDRLAEDVARAEAACEKARYELNALRVRKRKGYTLADSVRLAGRTDALRDTIRANCG